MHVRVYLKHARAWPISTYTVSAHSFTVVRKPYFHMPLTAIHVKKDIQKYYALAHFSYHNQLKMSTCWTKTYKNVQEKTVRFCWATSVAEQRCWVKSFMVKIKHDEMCFSEGAFGPVRIENRASKIYRLNSRAVR